MRTGQLTVVLWGAKKNMAIDQDFRSDICSMVHLGFQKSSAAGVLVTS